LNKQEAFDTGRLLSEAFGLIKEPKEKPAAEIVRSEVFRLSKGANHPSNEEDRSLLDRKLSFFASGTPTYAVSRAFQS